MEVAENGLREKIQSILNHPIEELVFDELVTPSEMMVQSRTVVEAMIEFGKGPTGGYLSDLTMENLIGNHVALAISAGIVGAIGIQTEKQDPKTPPTLLEFAADVAEHATVNLLGWIIDGGVSVDELAAIAADFYYGATMMQEQLDFSKEIDDGEGASA